MFDTRGGTTNITKAHGTAVHSARSQPHYQTHCTNYCQLSLLPPVGRRTSAGTERRWRWGLCACR